MRRWLQEFFRLEAASGLILIGASVLALLLANSAWGETYRHLLHLQLPVIPLGQWTINLSAQHFINDGLMALFFLLVAAEIKREMLGGQLSDRRALMLPLICAASGVIVPALIFTAFNHADAVAMRGWAVPTATDIAFALAMLAVLGSRVPLGLKLLLSTIAVVDDLIAIVIIAMFYTGDLHGNSLIAAIGITVAMALLNRRGVRTLWPYLLLGGALWIVVLRSGVHATLAGVVTGFLIPHVTGDDDTPDPDHSPSPLLRLEDDLHPFVAYGVLPLFALANAGLDLSTTPVAALVTALPMGVLLALLIGKPLGIFTAAWLGRRIGLVDYPAGVSHSVLLGMAILCGIGFTMSLFIASLAYREPLLQAEATLGVFAASVLSALIGVWWLKRTLPTTPADAE